MCIGNYIALLLSTSVVASPPPLCSSPLHLLVYEQSSEGSLKIPSEREATGAYAIRLLHVCGDVAFEKKKRRACVLKKDRVGWGGSSQATKVRQRTVRQQSALRLPAAWCGEGDPTCQRVRGLAE